MRIKYFFLLVIFLLFQNVTDQLHAVSGFDALTFDESSAELARRRYTVKEIAEEDLKAKPNDKNYITVQSFKGRTFLRYNVSGRNCACLFNSIQQERAPLIGRLIQAVESDHPNANQIIAHLRPGIYDKLAKEERLDYTRLDNPNDKITKEEVRTFLMPFANDNEFTPYDVALAYGALEGMKVHIWQDPNPGDVAHKLTLNGYTMGDFPKHLHIYYGLNSRLQRQGIPRAQGFEHFERLVLEGEPDVEYEKAKSLWIQKRIGTGRSSLLTNEELGLLRQKFPKPEVARPAAPQPQEKQSVTPKPNVAMGNTPKPQLPEIELKKEALKPVVFPLQRAKAKPRAVVSPRRLSTPVSRSLQQAPVLSKIQQRSPSILLQRKAPTASPTARTSRASPRLPTNLGHPSAQPNKATRAAMPPLARRISPAAPLSNKRQMHPAIQQNRATRIGTSPLPRRPSATAPLPSARLTRPQIQANKTVRTARTVIPRAVRPALGVGARRSVPLTHQRRSG